jgi:hypothetical protein
MLAARAAGHSADVLPFRRPSTAPWQPLSAAA